jgi:peptide/nickel transport system substrate-binding protein
MERSHTDPTTPGITNPGNVATTWLSPIQEKPFIGDVEKYGKRGSGEYAFQVVTYMPPQYTKGQLIEEWEVTYEKITWKVRQGVMWQPGKTDYMEARELVAEDVVADVEHFRNSIWGKKLEGIMGDVYATDRYTLILEFEQFSSLLNYWLGTEDRAIISPPEMQDVDSNKWENQVGTGGFMFDEYVDGAYMSYLKNPDYWGKTTIDGKEYQMPFIDKLIYVLMPDTSTQIAALRTGKVDLNKNVPFSQWATLDQNNPELIKARYGDSGHGVAFRTSKPPFDNRNVRRALMIGTDMEVFKKAVQAEDFPTHWFPNFWGNPAVYTPMEQLPDDIRELYNYDPAKAKKMLADAGYPNGFKAKHLTNSQPLSLDLAALLKDMWAKIGVDLEIVAVDDVTATQQTYNASYEDTAAVGIEVGSPVDTLLRMATTGGYLNQSEISVPYLDEMGEKIQLELDYKKQNAMVKEMGLYVLREAFYVPRAPIIRGHYWWPWVKNYDGEVSLHDFDMAALINFMWIDQDLKKSMGY